LRDERIVNALERTFGAACERASFRLAHYTIQRDHVHFIVEADGKHALSRGMQSIGARVARAVNRVLGRKGTVLRERFHLRILGTPREVRNALSYVLNNVRKHLGMRASRVGTLDPARRGVGSPAGARASSRWRARRPRSLRHERGCCVSAGSVMA
jgi:REP element-mobilizing transposase RayT